LPDARQLAVAHTRGVPLWESFSYLFGPLSAFLVVGLLVLLLRWAFSSGRSVVARRPRSGLPTDYGLLVSVATPPTYVEGELLRRTLEQRGVRATLAQTLEGPRVMVFPDDEDRARALLGQ